MSIVVEHRDVAAETLHCTINERDGQFVGYVAYQIACWHIVASIHHDVVIAYNLQRTIVVVAS